MRHKIEILPQNPEEVKAKMDAMGISEEGFTAEVFFHYYQAHDWLMRGEPIIRWSSLLVCWDRNGRKKHGVRPPHGTRKDATATPSASVNNEPTAVTEALPLGGGGGGLDLRSAQVSSWLDCQYPMPEEPEKRQEAEKLERCYSLQNEPQFGMWEHWKEILTSNTITLEAAAKHIGQGVVERIIIRHLDSLAAHFETSLLTFSLHEMQQTARWMIEKAGSLKLSELMLICQRAKEENMLSNAHVCRGDIKLLINNFPGWKRNTLQYLK